MERVAELTGGLVAVNPNTMYPLLRALEADGLVAGRVGAPRAPVAALLPADARRARPSATRLAARARRRAWTRSPPAIDAVRRELGAG